MKKNIVFFFFRLNDKKYAMYCFHINSSMYEKCDENVGHNNKEWSDFERFEPQMHFELTSTW